MAVISENIVEMRAEISLNENMVYIVKNGQIHPIKPPVSGHGKQIAVWINGKVDRVVSEFTEKIK
ncbi:DUF3954 domain-containing protein [Bacillus cereus]|nr:DUF3954 domain-containing protein [Bacillus cereus]MDA2306086.1 DUF3954 domain-containing protein [Bacillus cereus]